MTPCVDDGRPIAGRRNAQFYCFFGRFKTLNMLATFFPIRLFVGSRRLQTFSEKAFILITL
ncbi:unnamed protein product, partial [Pelagomonas calceolata]